MHLQTQSIGDLPSITNAPKINPVTGLLLAAAVTGRSVTSIIRGDLNEGDEDDDLQALAVALSPTGPMTPNVIFA